MNFINRKTFRRTSKTLKTILFCAVFPFAFLSQAMLHEKTIIDRTNSAVIPQLPYDEIKREKGR